MSPKRSGNPEKNYENGMEKALTLLEYRSRTCDQMRKLLLERGFPQEITEEVVDRLTELRLLDDERYAAGYLRERTRKGYGLRRSRYELQRRGIPDEILEEAAENVSEEDEEESAYSVGRKVWRKTVSMEWKKRRAKLYATLTQRGFGYETVDRVMRRLAREEAEEEDPDGFYD
ncbi:MAG: regulatory protein RecX [Clostridia bacterium]|nr:regulatory protein RecX [Clostridia bacterium]